MFNEHTRYRHAYADCAEQQYADRDLLMRDVCFNFEDRLRFRDTVDCQGAERRLRVPLVMCALQHWLAQSNAATLYSMLTGSFWALFATVMVPLLFGMWLLNSRATQLAMVERMGVLFKRARVKEKTPKQLKAFSSRDTAISYK